MPTLSDQALCIRHWDYSETSQTVSLFTRDHGVLRGLAKGAKRERGNFSGGIDLLTLGRFIAFTKPGRDLATLGEWHILDGYYHLRQSLAANRAAMFIADLLHQMVRDDDPHPQLFDTCRAALEAMTSDDSTFAVLLHVQWAVLRETGYQPELGVDAQTSRPLPHDSNTLAFSPQHGGTVTDTGEHDRWRVRRPTITLLRQVANGESLDHADPQALRRANKLLATYITHILGHEPPSIRWAFATER